MCQEHLAVEGPRSPPGVDLDRACGGLHAGGHLPTPCGLLLVVKALRPRSRRDLLQSQFQPGRPGAFEDEQQRAISNFYIIYQLVIPDALLSAQWAGLAQRPLPPQGLHLRALAGLPALPPCCCSQSAAGLARGDAAHRGRADWTVRRLLRLLVGGHGPGIPLRLLRGPRFPAPHCD